MLFPVCSYAGSASSHLSSLFSFSCILSLISMDTLFPFVSILALGTVKIIFRVTSHAGLDKSNVKTSHGGY